MPSFENESRKGDKKSENHVTKDTWLKTKDAQAVEY